MKWEVNAEQSAQKKSDLDPEGLHEDLALLVKHYQEDQAVQLPVGNYTVVLGPRSNCGTKHDDGILRYDGGAGLQTRLFFLEGRRPGGKLIFSEKISLTDDPDAVELSRNRMTNMALNERNLL